MQENKEHRGEKNEIFVNDELLARDKASVIPPIMSPSVTCGSNSEFACPFALRAGICTVHQLDLNVLSTTRRHFRTRNIYPTYSLLVVQLLSCHGRPSNGRNKLSKVYRQTPSSNKQLSAVC